MSKEYRHNFNTNVNANAHRPALNKDLRMALLKSIFLVHRGPQLNKYDVPKRLTLLVGPKSNVLQWSLLEEWEYWRL